jgi:hypothetical protein
MFRNWTELSSATAPWAKAVRLLVVLAFGLSVWRGYGQTLIPELGPGGRMQLKQVDLAVFEVRESRYDLPCTVSPIKPKLEWDFTFHTGFQVVLPLADLVGGGNVLTVLFRVFPQDRPHDPAYMVQRMRVSAVEQGSKGEIWLQGMFKLGEGKYHVDWLIRDRQERVCATSWDLEAKLNSKDSHLKQWIPRALVQPLESLFAEEPPVIRAPESGLPHVSIIVNFDPPDPSAATLGNRDLEGLVGILRRIGRDPRIGTYSIIACSFETKQVVFQQENASSIDLKALGEALASLKLGIVDAKRLASPKGPAQFATDLIRERLRKEEADALVVLGHKLGWETGVSRDVLESLEEPRMQTFYLSYRTEQPSSLWRDPVSTIVKRLRGTEYGINRPKDLFNAWSDMVSRIARTKQAAQTSTAAKSFTR